MKKARILIVEDEAIIAMGIERQLQSLGYEVTSMADTGEKAIKKAETAMDADPHGSNSLGFTFGSSSCSCK